MGKFFVDVIFIIASFCFFISILFSFLHKNNTKLNKIIVIINLFFGLLSAILIHILRINNKKEMVSTVTKLNRYAYSLCLFILIVMVIFIISKIFIHNKKVNTFLNTIILFFISFSSAIMIYLMLPQLFNLSMEFIAFGEDSVSTLTLFRVSGFALGISSGILMALSLYKLLIKSSEKNYKFLSYSILLVIFLEYFVKGISSLARLKKYIKLDFNINPIITEKTNILGIKVFDIMIFEDKSTPFFIGIYFLIITISVVVFIINNKSIKEKYDNNAQYRKLKWRSIVNRRWAISSFVFSLVFLFSVTFLNYYLTKPVELTAPEEYQEIGNNIVIPLSTVDDGHLHRFSYKKDGHDIRFIIVKKPNSTAYGVGLDACQICGVAGYYERKNDVICKRCDVVMNKATIGFKGGCNPIPFEFKIEDQKIIIDKEVLNKEKERFPVGE